MTIVPTAGGNPPSESSGYASLTGPGETTPEGALTQAGPFTVSTTLAVSIAAQTGVTIFSETRRVVIGSQRTKVFLHSRTTTEATLTLNGTAQTAEIQGAKEVIVWSGNGGSVRIGPYGGTGTLGFFGKTPVAQPAAIATPSATPASLQTAVKALIAALTSLGLIA